MTIRIPANIREGAQGTEDRRGPDQTTRIKSDGRRQLFGESAVVGSQPISRSSADEPPHAGLQQRVVITRRRYGGYW